MSSKGVWIMGYGSHVVPGYGSERAAAIREKSSPETMTSVHTYVYLP